MVDYTFVETIKVTVNQYIEIDQHPLPKAKELFATLSEVFSKIDMTQAYQQIVLDDESQKLVTMNTYCGLYPYTRLPFGIMAPPTIFQRAMDVLLQGIPNIVCCLYDILITRKTTSEHLQNLREVLRRLNLHKLRGIRAKCLL